MSNTNNESTGTNKHLHPKYYNTGNYEVIDVIDDWQLDFSLGCVLKYVARAGRKDPDKAIDDLEKAKNYIDFEIKKIRKGMNNKCQN